MIKFTLLFLIFAISSVILAEHAHIRISHACADAPGVDVYSDNDILVRNLLFTETSPYLKVPIGTHQVSVKKSGANIFFYSANITLNPGFSTILASGELIHNATHPFHLWVLGDVNDAPPSSDIASVRFGHWSPDSPTVSLVINGNYAAALSFSENTYISLQPAVYDVEMWVNATNVLLLKTFLTVKGGTVSTLFMEGLVLNRTGEELQFVRLLDASYRYLSLRFSHASPDTPTVDVFLNEQIAFSSVSFTHITHYISKIVEKKEKFLFQLKLAGSSKTILSQMVHPCGKENTIVALGASSVNGSARLHLRSYMISIPPPKTGYLSSLVALHASPNAPRVDIFANGTSIWNNLHFGRLAPRISIQAGYYHIQIKPAGQNSIFYSTHINLNHGTNYLLSAEGLISPHYPDQAFRLTSHIEGTFSYHTWRFTHALPSAPNVDVYVDQVLRFSDISYLSATHFSPLSLLTGNRSVCITSHSSNETLFASSLAVSAETEVSLTIGLVGTLSSPMFFSLKNDNSPPSSDKEERIRFVNLSPDSPPLSVLIDGVESASSLSFLSASAFLVEPSKQTMIQLALPNSSIIFSKSIELNGGTVYTCLIEGLVKSLALSNIRDYTFEYFNLQFSHLSPDAPALDLLLDSHPIFTGISFQTSTPFIQSISTGYKKVSLNLAGKNQTLFSHSFLFSPKETTTLFAIGKIHENSPSPLTIRKVPSILSAPSSSTSSFVRFFHSIPSIGPVEIKANGKTLFSSLPFGSASHYLPLESQNYTISAYLHSRQILSTSLFISGGSVITASLAGDISSPFFIFSTDISYQYLNLRFIHSSPDLGPVALSIDGNTPKEWEDIDYKGVTSYLVIPAGLSGSSTHFHVSIHSKSGVEKTEKMNLPIGGPVSLILSGLASTNSPPTSTPYAPHHPPHSTLRFTSVLDRWTTPSLTSNFYLRAIHLSPNSAPLLIRDNGDNLFSMNYGDLTEWVERPQGLHNFSLFDSNDQFLTSLLVHLQGEGVYTLLIEGLNGGIGETSLSLLLIHDFLLPPSFFLRLFHLSPTSSPVNFFLNSSLLVSQVPFGISSSYLREEERKGNYKVSVVDPSTDSFLYSSPPTHFSTNHAYSFMWMGLPQLFTSLVLHDDLTLPPQGWVKVRFIHASPDCPSLDLSTNQNDLVKNISYTEVSEYYILKAKEYSVGLHTSKGQRTELKRENIQFSDSPTVYTVIIEGLFKDLRITTYVDSTSPSPPPAPPKKSNWKVALIVVFSILGAIVLLAGGYVVYKKTRHVGYSPIPSVSE